MKPLHSYLMLSLSLILSSGCRYANTPERANELMISGWAGPTAYNSTADSVYCYHTLGRKDCYAAPQIGWDNRLAGFYEPPLTSSIEIIEEDIIYIQPQNAKQCVAPSPKQCVYPVQPKKKAPVKKKPKAARKVCPPCCCAPTPCKKHKKAASGKKPVSILPVDQFAGT